MKKVLFTLMAVVLCLGLMGGAFAYFSDVEKSTGNVMSAGTLDMQIGDNDEVYTNSGVSGTFSSPSDLAPGDTFETNWVYLKNVGTIDIRWIFARFCNLVESNGVNTDQEVAADPGMTVYDISKYIVMNSIYESNNGGATWVYSTFDAATADAFLAYWNSRGAGFALDGKISLWDLYQARDYGSGDHVTSLLLLNSGFSNPALPVGSVAAFKFGFTLDASVGNAYQGDTATFEVDFIGTQHDAYPDDELVETGLGTLGP